MELVKQEMSIIMKKISEINEGYDKRFKLDELFPVHSSVVEIHHYFYPEIGLERANDRTSQKPLNLNPEIVRRIEKKLGLRFANGKEENIPESASPVCYANSEEVTEEFKIELPPQTFATIDILDYVYAILSSSKYRGKYQGSLNVNSLQIPYPKSQFIFWQLVKLGKELRQIHLFECTVVEKLITSYPVSGNNVVGAIMYRDNKIFINDTQYFDHVPQIVWNFYIDNYQPAQKWLNDRTGKELNVSDILHYQKIIVALSETNRIMNAIDKIGID